MKEKISTHFEEIELKLYIKFSEVFVVIHITANDKLIGNIETNVCSDKTINFYNTLNNCLQSGVYPLLSGVRLTKRLVTRIDFN